MGNKKFDSEPVGLYVHIPFCEAKCRYCGFYSEPIKNHAPERLISAIIAELSEKRGPFDFAQNRQESFCTIYIGGGSPSCLPAEQLLRLIREITSNWPKPEEFTIEIGRAHV